MTTVSTSPAFYYGQEVQVCVRDVPGAQLPYYMPCMPEPGSRHTITRLQNGTIVRFLEEFVVGFGAMSDAEEKLLIFEVDDNVGNKCRVMVPNLPHFFLKLAKRPRVRRWGR